MKLVKAGPARLTISNTNIYTGGTFVSGGALYVNGALDASPVTVERRGTPEGPSQFGGAGRLGAGLTVQAGCVVIVGQGTNSPGTLTVSNGVTELGAVNRFELSNDPTGAVKANDVVQIYGNLALSGTNTIEISQLDGSLGGGIYPLFKYTGTISGGLANLVLSGSFIQGVALTNPPGMIALVASIPGAPPVAPSALVTTAAGAFQINLSWTDNSGDENAFLIERSVNGVAFVPLAVNPPNDTTYSEHRTIGQHHLLLSRARNEPRGRVGAFQHQQRHYHASAHDTDLAWGWRGQLVGRRRRVQLVRRGKYRRLQ